MFFQKGLANVIKLQELVREAFAKIAPEMLRDILLVSINTVNICLVNEGHIFEHSLYIYFVLCIISYLCES